MRPTLRPQVLIPLLLLIPGLTQTGCVEALTETRSEQAEFPAGIARIELDVEAGDVTVTGADVEVVTGVRTISWTGNAEPGVATSVEGSVLTLLAECPKLGGCSVDFELQVPRGTEVLAVMGSGDGAFSGFLGELLAEVGSGDVTAAELGGPVTITTGSGDLDLRDLEATTLVETGSGDVIGSGLAGGTLGVSVGSGDVELEAAAASVSRVDIDTGSGDVRLQVASGTWSVAIETGSGDVVQSGVSNDKDAARSLEVRTGSGDVTILGI